jgi:hypothetical protein
MALIMEPGNGETARWVKTGASVGHFVIQEIRPGSIVYLDGEQALEMAIEQDTTNATMAAQSGGPAGARPPVVATAEAARLPAPAQRPARSRSMTVGSARTAALD